MKWHHLGAGPSAGTKYTPSFSASSAAKSSPESEYSATSFTSAGGSMHVSAFPVAASHPGSPRVRGDDVPPRRAVVLEVDDRQAVPARATRALGFEPRAVGPGRSLHM